MENILIGIVTTIVSMYGCVYIVGRMIPGGTDDTKFVVASISILTGCIIVCTKVIVDTIKESKSQ
jgi:hypothetical protein